MKTPAEWIEYKKGAVPWLELIAAIQREAMEEAAQVADRRAGCSARTIADDIRALVKP
jgi:hypothetical protein